MWCWGIAGAVSEQRPLVASDVLKFPSCCQSPVWCLYEENKTVVEMVYSFTFDQLTQEAPQDCTMWQSVLPNQCPLRALLVVAAIFVVELVCWLVLSKLREIKLPENQPKYPSSIHHSRLEHPESYSSSVFRNKNTQVYFLKSNLREF